MFQTIEGPRTPSRLFTAALITLMGLGLVMTPSRADAQTDKSDSFYVVMAHPDDETATWQLIDDFQDHYSIFVTTTHGEGTWGCITEEDTWTYNDMNGAPMPKNHEGRPILGPYMYEGPDSPVGEPDLNERHPLGDPWRGQGEEACGRARLASWHWFLDDMAAVDPGFPDLGISSSESGDPWADDDYKGEFCVPGSAGSENGPDRKGLGCADVWANEMGARVAFDFGNGSLEEPQPYTESEVIEAIETLSASRADWGIRVLPEAGLMSAAPSCDIEGHNETFHHQHETVSNALYNHDFGMGPQYGAVCDGNTNSAAWYLQGKTPPPTGDRRFLAHPGYQQAADAAEWSYMNSFDPVTFERKGPVQVHYGWLADGSGAASSPVDEEIVALEHNPGAWDFPLRTMWKRYGGTAKNEMFFVVAAHPDDEMNSWAMIEEKIDRDTYGVFVTMTQGEGTTSCLKPTDPLAKDGEHYTGPATFIEGIEANITSPSTGPYKYQGPDSPVDEDDMGERHPLGFPWKGQGSKACKDARIASWHWFLDDVHAKFGLGTSFEIAEDPRKDDDYLGKLCGAGSDVCADVWADEDGARVAFDLGNTVAIPLPDETWTYGEALFGVEDVIEGLRVLLDNRQGWGMPELPSTGMVSASTYYDGLVCAQDKNPDHKLIQDALSGFDFGAGPQFGPLLCQADPYGESGQALSVLSPKTLVEIQLVDPVTENRAGSLLNENYGWLFPSYLYTKSAEQYFKAFD